MKYWHRIAVVAALAGGLLTAGILTRRAPTPEQTFSRVSDRLLCQCNCGQHLNGCNMHPCGSAYPMRDEIRAGMAAGKNEEQIVKDFVTRMGAVVLAQPPTEGFALAAWLMPIAALLFGLFVIYRVVRGLRMRPAPATAAPTAASSQRRDELLKRYGTAIDEELERDA